jgi:hypothetical protein
MRKIVINSLINLTKFKIINSYDVKYYAGFQPSGANLRSSSCIHPQILDLKKGLSLTNTLAYFPVSSVTNQKGFIA